MNIVLEIAAILFYVVDKKNDRKTILHKIIMIAVHRSLFTTKLKTKKNQQSKPNQTKAQIYMYKVFLIESVLSNHCVKNEALISTTATSKEKKEESIVVYALQYRF